MANKEEVDLPEDQTWQKKLVRKWSIMGMLDRFFLRMERKRKTKYLIWGVLLGVLLGVIVGLVLWA